jgi:hypothetical protein
MTTPTLDDRRSTLGARIRAAQSRLEAGKEGPGMGALLAELNDEVDAIAHEDHDAAQRAYDKVEARLAAERIREEDDAEEDDA